MPDAALLDAIDLAREVAVETAGDENVVGAHLGAAEAGDRLVTHVFACHLPGYRGWAWQVTVARAPRAKTVTVCESHLVPADDALLAPAWVPWAERVRPGDLEPSMVLPYNKEDHRVVPGYAETGDEDMDRLAIWELGLGRERVLAPEGREEAAERWYRGSHGPTAASALASASPCATCAFMIPMSGSMRGAFGVCANEWSPSDGRVVSLDHGCGAHSETDVESSHSDWPDPNPLLDTDSHDAVDMADTTGEDEPEVVAEAADQVGAAGDLEVPGEADPADETSSTEEPQTGEDAPEMASESESPEAADVQQGEPQESVTVNEGDARQD